MKEMTTSTEMLEQSKMATQMNFFHKLSGLMTKKDMSQQW